MHKMYSYSVRPATVRLVTKLIAPLLDSGVVTNTEYNAIYKNLTYLAKKGEQMSPVPPRLITGQEAASILGISFSQFRTLEREGAFPFKRRIVGGRNVRYRNTDLYAYMDIESVIAVSPHSAEADAPADAKDSTNNRPNGLKAS